MVIIMGYTHYWYRDKEIPMEIFKKIVDDFRKLVPAFRMLDIQLADGTGEGEPTINYDEVISNGTAYCEDCEDGRKIVIPWPDDEIIPLFPGNSESAVSGSWFAGDLLKQRACSGKDCSYETFYFPRALGEKDGLLVGEIAYYKEDGTPVYHDKRVVGKWFDSCKTAFRPYDLAVISFLIIAKHHLKDKIIVRTDGKRQHWQDGFQLCQYMLGYGKEYTIEKGELVELPKPRNTLDVWIER